MAERRAHDLATTSAMAHALAAREVSSEELVVRAIREAEAWQPSTNAFSQLWVDEALAEARRQDTARDDTRPYAGLPIAVKDLFDVANHETTACCLAYKGNVAAQDAPTIAAIRRAGLVLIGKTNQHELAAGGTNTVSACGRTANPWDIQRITGGSSGGSGAAVAAGVVPWAFGSDTGGSIRIPASFCGTFGLKPTTGKLSTAGMLPLCPALDCPGPMAATAEDLAILYALMGGEPFDPSRRTNSWRVGVLGGFFARSIHPEVLAGVEAAAQTLASAGVGVETLDGEGIDDVRAVWRRICYRGFSAAYALPPERYELVAPSVRDWMEQGKRFSADELTEASRRRQEIAAWFRQRLQRVEALLIPSTPYPAPLHDQQEISVGTATVLLDQVGPGWLTCSINVAGLPAVCVPAGRSSEGMPFGVTFVGRDDGEAALLQLAALWSDASGYTPTYPSLSKA